MICEPEVQVLVGPADNPLTISSICVEEGTAWSSLALPDWAFRLTYAPPSTYIDGNVLLSAVEDSGEVTMLVNVQGSDAEDLEDRKAALKAALAAWPGEFQVILVEEAGDTVIAGPWQSFPTAPRWGEVTALLRGAGYLQDATFAIPVNPIGAP